MTKRSITLSELESELRDMLTTVGGISETRWVSRYIELLQEATAGPIKDYLLKVFLNTPQAEKAIHVRFIQLGGVEVLGTWLSLHGQNAEPEDIAILHNCLFCLNKLVLSIELLNKTQIGRIVNKLTKHPDSVIQTKANTIVSKWKKMVSEPEEVKRAKPKNEKVIILHKKPKIQESIEEVEHAEEVLVPKSPNENIEAVEKYVARKQIRWAEQESLETLKFFWKTDEPNAKCATLRPIENLQEEEDKRAISVEDLRKREIQMEGELNKKEKEKDGQVKVMLENMTPRLNYSAPIRLNISTTNRRKIDSLESTDQLKREYSVQRAIYQRESEIPRSPVETFTQRQPALMRDIITIPFFKVGSFPPVVIKLTEAANEDFMKILYSGPAQMLPAQFVPPHALMPTPQPYPQPSYLPHMQPMHMPGLHMPPHSLPPRPASLPSMNLSQEAYMYGGQTQPIYDPQLMANDPYQLINKSRMIFNPMNKKPSNYRTVPCRRFHSNDGCERGDMCHFIHNFQYQGRPIPNFQSQFKKQPEGYNPGIVNYYPPDAGNHRGY